MALEAEGAGVAQAPIGVQVAEVEQKAALCLFPFPLACLFLA